MNVTCTNIKQLAITGPDFDPIRVMIENIEPGRGRITITCWDESWVNYWGAMGEGKTIEQFFLKASTSYLAGKLSTGILEYIYDRSEGEKACRKHVIQERRARDISKREARDLFNDIDSEDFGDDPGHNAKLFQEIFGDEWWYGLPETPNPKYVQLCKVVETVKAGLRMHAEQVVPA